MSPLLLPRQQLLFSKSTPHHCLLLLYVSCPDEKTLFLRFLSRLPRGHRSLLRKSACFVPEAPNVPTKRPQVATSQGRPVPIFVATSPRPCGAASCSCEPELPTGTTSLSWDRTPLWHGFGSSVAQVPALASSLFPTWCHFNKYDFCIALYHCVKVTHFCYTSLKNNNWSQLLWCTCPNKSSRGPWPLRKVPTYRPSEPFCNTTYHVRRTFWVFHRSGTL